MKTQIVVTKIIEFKHDETWSEKDLKKLATHLTTNPDIEGWDIKQPNIKEAFCYCTVYKKAT